MYLQEISQRYTSDSHHAFLLHGNTRDLQIGDTGSTSLVDHMMGKFAAMGRLAVCYRVGIGWRFAVESDKQELMQIAGISSNSSDFAGLGQSDDDLPLDATSAIGIVDLALRQTKKRVAIVLDRLELIAPNSPYDRIAPGDKAILSILQALAADNSVAQSENILIGVTDNLVDLHESLKLASSRFYAIEILPPDHNERAQIAAQVLPQLQEIGCQIELSPAEFASATSMMTRYGIMDILMDAKATKTLARQQVRTIKAQVMSQEYGDILETLDPIPNGLDGIAGMDALKTYFLETITGNMISGNYADVPAGLLLAGAPGLGKSYFMRGVAGASGLPVINFNVGRLLGSYVGQSERNLERAITAIKSAAPCIVVLDEIETTFPDRASSAPAGDSGVSSRILKRMLEVLSDPSLRGRVVWIGITNYPKRLDAALSRAGRFDLTVAFLPPTEYERADLLLLYAEKYNVPVPSDEDTIDLLAEQTAGYTNAELENVVRKARSLVSKGNSSVADCWIDAKQRVRSNTRDVAAMTDAALECVNDADLLHPDYLDRWRVVTGQVETKAPAASASTIGKRLF